MRITVEPAIDFPWLKGKIRLEGAMSCAVAAQIAKHVQLGVPIMLFGRPYEIGALDISADVHSAPYTTEKSYVELRPYRGREWPVPSALDGALWMWQ